MDVRRTTRDEGRETRDVVIIGGGISGLSVLHYLKKKFAGQPQTSITLLEASPHPGGTARTISEDGFLFETGPNGFLSSKPTTLELIHDLGLENELIEADAAAKIRYLSLGHKLYPLPTNLVEFLRFPLFSLAEKLRIPAEMFISKGCDPNESVYDFGKRRLGTRFSEIFLDAMVTGIFGGDVRNLHLASAFPLIHKIEQTYGSLIKGMICLGLDKRQQKRNQAANPSKEARFTAEPRGTLTSFKKGMGQLSERIYELYQDAIHLNEEVVDISSSGTKRFLVKSNKGQYTADTVFICTPAYIASRLLKDFQSDLANELNKVEYAPMAVVGLIYKAEAFPQPPKGFGYLVPSINDRPVLGVLLSSNIFPAHGDEGFVLVRVMIGGSRAPKDVNFSKDKLWAKIIARKEIKNIYDHTAVSLKEFFIQWPKAIPQYNLSYPEIKNRIETILPTVPGLKLVANYLGGISVNDCIAQAAQAVETLPE